MGRENSTTIIIGICFSLLFKLKHATSFTSTCKVYAIVWEIHNTSLTSTPKSLTHPITNSPKWAFRKWRKQSPKSYNTSPMLSKPSRIIPITCTPSSPCSTTYPPILTLAMTPISSMPVYLPTYQTHNSTIILSCLLFLCAFSRS